jgi:hypothetical protein
MAPEPSAVQKSIGDVAPKLADLTDTVHWSAQDRPGGGGWHPVMTRTAHHLKEK